MRGNIHVRAFTILEVTLACAIFSILVTVLMLVLRQTTEIWRKTSAKDEAVRQLVRARSSLQRDLANASGKPGQSAVAKIGPHLGSGFDGDALTFLSSDDGGTDSDWASDPSSAQAALPGQITYYLVIPNVPNPDGLAPSAGPADSNGYEQQDPYKWLIRQVDPNTSTTTPQTVNSTWTSWLTRPTSMAVGANRRVIATQMLGFRVLRGAPLWTLELSAVGVSEARGKIALGGVPLAQSRFTVYQRLSVPTNN